MKYELQSLASRATHMARRSREALRLALLAPAVALMSMSPGAFAALPAVTAPTDGLSGACTDGDIVCTIGAFFKQGINMAAVVVAAFFLIVLALGSFSRWKQYSAGRVEIGDLKEYLIAAAVLAGIVLLLATLAINYVGTTTTAT